MFERVICYEALCDEPGCLEGTEMFLPLKDLRRRPEEARRCAREQGWTILADDKAFCPQHNPGADLPPRA